MASEQVWVVAACFNEAEVISVFLERVMPCRMWIICCSLMTVPPIPPLL